MINLFRRAQAINLILLFFVMLLLRVSVLFQIQPNILTKLKVYQPSAQLLAFFNTPFTLNIVTNVLITGIIIYAQALIFGRIITRYVFFSKTTFLPELIFVVLSSMFSTFLTLSPIIICSFLLLWLLEQLLALYKSGYVLQSVFNMALVISLGSLIYFPFIFVFPIIWVSLIIFKSFSWREWVTALIGLSIPYLLLATWYFWNDNVPQFEATWLHFDFILPSPIVIEPNDYLGLIPFMLILLLSINTVLSLFFKNIVQIRKSLQSFFFLIVFIVLAYFLLPNIHINHLMLMIAPLSVFISFYFTNAKITWLYETLFIALLASVFYFQLS